MEEIKEVFIFAISLYSNILVYLLTVAVILCLVLKCLVVCVRFIKRCYKRWF